MENSTKTRFHLPHLNLRNLRQILNGSPNNPDDNCKRQTIDIGVFAIGLFSGAISTVISELASGELPPSFVIPIVLGLMSVSAIEFLRQNRILSQKYKKTRPDLNL